ncbi:MAG TPA: DUF3054 domain-containing protein [Arachnia sp.]|nr:DUF3054 domain-containing protein [Arachnia sp.]
MSRIGPLLLDLVLVAVFAAVGRASHGEGVAGVFVTAWPFLVACLIAWLVLGVLKDDGVGLRGAAIVWLVTWAGGMALRVSAGSTAQSAFLVVAALTLALFLGGWRLIAWLLRRRRPA